MNGNLDVVPSDRDRMTEELYRHKGSNRIQINNILSAVCMAALSVLLGVAEKANLNPWMVGQLAIAVPCLVTSSLAYAKTCYRRTQECEVWDTLGWFTHTVGYIFILNAVGILLLTNGFEEVAWLFMALTMLQFVVYSVLDVLTKRDRLREKAWKLGFYFLLFGVGFVLPARRWI